MWRKDLDIQILESSTNFIHASLSFRSNPISLDCTFTYGDPVPHRRNALWHRLAGLQYRRDHPWGLIGDFNQILFPHEKDGLRPQPPALIQHFRDFLHSTELMDLELKGCKYTWQSNPKQGFITRERIDRVLANWSWRSLFPNARAIAYPSISSDHSPILF